MKAEILKVQKILQRYRQLKYPAILAVLLIAANFVIYYGYLLPNQQRIIDQEQAWRNSRDQFGRTLEQQNAQDNLEEFRKLLLTKNEFAKRVVNQLSETAKRLNLNLPAVSYKPETREEEKLTKMNFSFEVSGGYTAIRRFIHAIETSSDFLIIEDLILAAQGSKDKQSVDLKVRLVTYLK
jgi:Tfp pilus assembly protein PilO